MRPDVDGLPVHGAGERDANGAKKARDEHAASQPPSDRGPDHHPVVRATTMAPATNRVAGRTQPCLAVRA
jgi:hypothetical protein